MAERLRIRSVDGVYEIRGIRCDMGEPTFMDIIVETDGDIQFTVRDKNGRAIADLHINGGATQTPGLARALAPTIRSFVDKNSTE